MYFLRELERRDLAAINRWRNDKELIGFLGTNFRYINRAVDEAWYDNYLLNRASTVRCAIVSDNGPDDIIGLVSLTDIDQLNRSCIFHIMIGNTENRGKGVGTFAAKEIIDHAFDNMNMNRIELTVLESNMASRRLCKKVGFVEEGLQRQVIYKDGAYQNMVLMSILKSERDAQSKRVN